MNDSSKTSTMGPSLYGVTDKAKEFQMEILMEKLRSKTSQHKNLAETSKAVRMTMLDKRWALDIADRMILQKCLDSLQHCIKVSSLQSLIERLECLARQLGLKFMVGTSGVDLFISSDMFYLEILLDTTGAVKDVKIHHDGKIEQQSCDELVSCISRGDFADFTAQLEGLTAIYQLNAEKKVKCKAFSALQSLETDLGTLAQLQSFIKDPWAQVHKSPIGFLQKRRGGHAMRLTFFVSPYELLDKDKVLQQLTTELLTMGKPVTSGGQLTVAGTQYTRVGLSATVLLEGSTAHKLQVAPIISIAQRAMSKSGPVEAPLGLQNSSMLPACFTLKLSQAMPMCSSLAKLMHSQTEVECAGDWANAKPLLGLIVQHTFSQLVQGKNIDLNLNRGLFVTLPDQSQCYFLTERRGLEGTLVSSVPFTHPTHVPNLLNCLRQQALFNTLIASCVRPHSRQDLESMLMFEASALSWQHISISLEHPLDESMATVELDLTDTSAPRASIYTLNTSPRENMEPLNEYISCVLQKSQSIPIMLRSLVKFWEREASSKQLNGGYSALDNSNFSLGLGPIDPGGPESSMKQEGGIGGTIGGGNRAMYPGSVNHPHQGTYLSDMQHNISMLSSQDAMGVDIKNKSVHQNHVFEDRKSRKRKAEDISSPWSMGNKKTKGHIATDSWSESEDSEASEEMEEENMMNSNTSNDEDEDRLVSPGSQPGFTSDLELSGLEVAEHMGGSSNDNRLSSDMENSGDGDGAAPDVEEIIRSSSFQKAEHKKQKHKAKDSSDRSGKINSSVLLDLTDNTPYMPPSVSITPIGSGNSSGVQTGSFGSVLGLDRHPGIEIIPISSSAPTVLPSSITITPITSSQAKSMEERHRSERKSSRSNEERSRDKKKKKRREDPMGPPEKLPPKQDPLTKPVSVSIKPTDGAAIAIRSSSPPNSLIRKFSPSPTHGRSGSTPKSSSPGGARSAGKPSGAASHHVSPRHSPIPSSPKHLSGYSSPKNHSTSSPKHGSSGSGKPSMSALKSVTAGSPSGKSGGYDMARASKVAGSKDSSSSRDRDRKSQIGASFTGSGGGGSPKIKSSSVKLKQLEITPILTDVPAPEGLVSPPGLEVSKCSVPSQVRNRKGSLSAVIDKLKSAQHCGAEGEVTVTRAGSSGGATRDRTSGGSGKLSDTKSGGSNSGTKLSDSKNQEYMVKPSSDGMKITINKTRTKDSSNSKSNSANASSSSGTSKQAPITSSSSASTGSLKTHTGLKPGVLSGPASKKTQVMQSSKSGSLTIGGSLGSSSSNSSSAKTSNSGSISKVPYKSNSSSLSGINVSKSLSKSSSGSPKGASTDLSKLVRDRDKIRNSKNCTGKIERRLSPAPPRDDVDGERNSKTVNKESNFLVEGLIKSLDTSKFQIPKLSARATAEDGNLQKQLTPEKNNFVLPDSNKIMDYAGRTLDHGGGKYGYQHSTNQSMQKNAGLALNLLKPVVNLSSISPKLQNSQLTNIKTDNFDQPTNLSFNSKLSSDGKNSKDKLSDTVKSPQHANSKEESAKVDLNIPSLQKHPFPSISVCTAETLNQNYAKQLESGKGFIAPQSKVMSDENLRKNYEMSMKPPHGAIKVGSTTSQEAAEILLDFSSSSGSKNKLTSVAERALANNAPVRRNTPPLGPPFPASPSVSVHIVKSPVPSPLIIPSPHSNSPCITDDELMDEALVGPGK